MPAVEPGSSLLYDTGQFSVTVIRQTDFEQLARMTNVWQGLGKAGWEDRLGARLGQGWDRAGKWSGSRGAGVQLAAPGRMTLFPTSSVCGSVDIGAHRVEGVWMASLELERGRGRRRSPGSLQPSPGWRAGGRCAGQELEEVV